MKEIEGSEYKVDVDLVLIAAGFLGSESYVTKDFGVKVDARTNVETEKRLIQNKRRQNFCYRRYAQRSVSCCMGYP